jgi:glycosyltransferase involved in cell wall biosynthesis
MDIVIKSFNRPYYLERCIRSVEQNVSGSYNIVVLDDGTPERYLQKIHELFPKIKILKSNLHALKSQGIADHLAGRQDYNFKTIPSGFWINSIARASDIFLLMEEDAWFTGPVSVDEISQLMSSRNIVTLKLFWCGNADIVKGQKIKINSEVEEVIPKLPINNAKVFSLLMSDKFRLRTLMRRSGLLTKKFILPYYGLYTVSSAFFQKDYWLALWNNSGDYVNEERQIANAMRWKANHRETRYAKTLNEKVRTTYIVSSISHLHSAKFDFITFNHFMNEAWLDGALNATENLPGDFGETYLEKFLPANTSYNINVAKWKMWIHEFQKQFRNQGCKVDRY